MPTANWLGMRATAPVWSEAQAQFSEYPTLESSTAVEVDAVVIGAGITGLTTALLLKRSGKRVAVIEARRIASGVSRGTSAHLTAIVDSRYQQLERDFGEQGAKDVASSSLAAIDLIEGLIKELGIDCGFKRVPGHLFAQTEAQERELIIELDAARRAGLTVSQVKNAPLPFETRLAMRVENQALFNPLPYLAGLARAIEGDGSFIFENTPVIRVTDGEPCSIETSTGATLTAASVILATHSPLNVLLLQTKIAHYQSYVVSGPTQSALEGLFWDMDEPYHYIRSFDSGRGSQLVIGGEDRKTGQDHDTQGRFDALIDYAKRFEVTPDRLWSAQVVEPVDGLPFIGRNSASKHVFVGTGYSGNGLTFGTLAAMLMSDLVMERSNPWHALYAATRIKPLAALGTYLAENKDFPLELLSTAFKPAEAKTVSAVAVGEGRIVEVDGKQLAVFRDEHGALHAVSSLCTHLGCRVAFNGADRSWDCPCHGSRFTVDGAVLAGPAITPLTPVQVSDEPTAERVS